MASYNQYLSQGTPISFQKGEYLSQCGILGLYWPTLISYRLNDQLIMSVFQWKHHS